MIYQKVTAKLNGVSKFIILFIALFMYPFLSILFFTKSDIRIFIALFFAFVTYSLYHIVSKLTFLSANMDYLKIGLRTKVSYDQIQNIKLYDVIESRFLFIPMYDQGLSITFKDGKKTTLKDNYCKNLWQIRWFLEKRFIENKTSFTFDYSMDFTCTGAMNITTPKSLFTKSIPSLLNSLLISFITTLILSLYGLEISPWYPIISFLGLMILVIFSAKAFYIESCDNGLFIKNLGFSRFNKKISLDLIKNIKIKQQGGGRNRSTVLIIHTIFHRDYKHPIDSINYDRAKNIIQQIKKLNINFEDHTGLYREE